MNYNHGTYVGRLTADPTVKPLASGTTLLTFRIAVSDDRPNDKGEFETDFIPVVVWGTRAERYATRLRKGLMVLVDGKYRNRAYNDKEGKKRYRQYVESNWVKVLERQSATPTYNPFDDKDPFDDSLPPHISDDDLPF